MSEIIRKKNRYFLLITLVFVATFISAMIYFGVLHRSSKNIKIDGVFLQQATSVSPFNLTDQNGDAFTQSNLKGRWTFLFFGFTNCGYVCPTTLTELNKMYKTLEKELPNKQLPQIVLVTVDPERDTISRMKDYVNAFNPNFVGVRADLSVTEQLERELHIVAVKMQSKDQSSDHYSINHSAEILLFNPEGKIQAYLSYPHQADQMAADYKLILRTYG